VKLFLRGYLCEKLKAESDGLRQIRLGIGFAKNLMNEAIPIGLFAKRYFAGRSDVCITLKVGNQSFDAIVSDARSEGASVSYIEVTLAHKGETEYLRMLHLHNTGEVSGLGKVTKLGTRRTGLVVDVAREMTSQTEVLTRERELVARAIERKLDAHYPRGTLLLIGIDDTMSFDRKENIENLDAVLYEYTPKLNAFHSIAIVGLYNGLFLHQKTGDAT